MDEDSSLHSRFYDEYSSCHQNRPRIRFPFLIERDLFARTLFYIGKKRRILRKKFFFHFLLSDSLQFKRTREEISLDSLGIVLMITSFFCLFFLSDESLDFNLMERYRSIGFCDKLKIYFRLSIILMKPLVSYTMYKNRFYLHNIRQTESNQNKF